jgi:hypothetical protein
MVTEILDFDGGKEFSRNKRFCLVVMGVSKDKKSGFVVISDYKRWYLSHEIVVLFIFFYLRFLRLGNIYIYDGKMI